MDFNLTKREEDVISRLTLLKQEAVDNGKFLNLDTNEIISRDEALKIGLNILEPDMLAGSFDSIRDWLTTLHDEVQVYRDKLIARMGTLVDLPIDVLFNIIILLPPATVRALCIINIQMAEICRDENLWQFLVLRTKPGRPKPDDVESWRKWSKILENDTIQKKIVMELRGEHAAILNVSADAFAYANYVNVPTDGRPITLTRKRRQPEFGGGIITIDAISDRGHDHFAFIIYTGNIENFSMILVYGGTTFEKFNERVSRAVVNLGYSLIDGLNVTGNRSFEQLNNRKSRTRDLLIGTDGVYHGYGFTFQLGQERPKSVRH